MHIITIAAAAYAGKTHALQTIAALTGRKVMRPYDFSKLLDLMDAGVAHISLDTETYVDDVEPLLYQRIQKLAKTFGSNYRIYVGIASNPAE